MPWVLSEQALRVIAVILENALRVIGLLIASLLVLLAARSPRVHAALRKYLGKWGAHGKSGPVKSVLLVRADLKMTKGKAIAQAMHAAYAAGKAEENTDVIQAWEKGGHKKVSLRVASEKEMKHITQQARNASIPVHPIRDAGKTQVDPNTWTVTFIGPYYESVIDALTGHLSLY